MRAHGVISVTQYPGLSDVTELRVDRCTYYGNDEIYDKQTRLIPGIYVVYPRSKR